MGNVGRLRCMQNGQQQRRRSYYYLIAIQFLVGTLLIDVGVLGQHIVDNGGEHHCVHKHPDASEVKTILLCFMCLLYLSFYHRLSHFFYAIGSSLLILLKYHGVYIHFSNKTIS